MSDEDTKANILLWLKYQNEAENEIERGKYKVENGEEKLEYARGKLRELTGCDCLSLGVDCSGHYKFSIGDLDGFNIPQADMIRGRLNEISEYLENVWFSGNWYKANKLAASLRGCFEQLRNIAKNCGGLQPSIYLDFAPLSFGWDAGGMSGGLIFHGDVGQFSSGSPTFSTTLENVSGWSLHS